MSLAALLALVLVVDFGLHLELWRYAARDPYCRRTGACRGYRACRDGRAGRAVGRVRVRRWRGAGGSGGCGSIAALALANLRRLPARTLLGAAGLFVGVARLTVLVAIERSFGGTLVGTLLGNAISVQVRGSDFVAVGLTILLAAVSVADVLYLNLRERAAELATLRAVGWSDGQLCTTVVLEALGMGLIGSVSGAVLGLVFGRVAAWSGGAAVGDGGGDRWSGRNRGRDRRFLGAFEPGRAAHAARCSSHGVT